MKDWLFGQIVLTHCKGTYIIWYYKRNKMDTTLTFTEVQKLKDFLTKNSRVGNSHMKTQYRKMLRNVSKNA